jgi:hypothetical protein
VTSTTRAHLASVVLAAGACWARASAAPRFAPDLIGNLTGGHLLATDSAHLYDPDAQHAWQTSLTHHPTFFDLYVSPPHTALLFRPLAALPLGWACAAFTALSLAAFAFALVLARPLAPREELFAFAVLAFAASEPFAETIVMGQTSALSLLVWVAGIRLALARRDFAAGAVFGLGLFKPQLFVVVPLVLLATKRRRALAGFATSAAVLVSLGVIAAGSRSYVAWIELLESPSYLVVRAANQFHMCSVEAMMRGLLPPEGSAVLPIAAHVVVSVVVVGLLLDAARRKTSNEAGVWAMAVLVTLVAAPHVIIYDLVLLFIPAIAMSMTRASRIALASLFVLAWVTPVLGPALQGATWPLRALAAPLLAIPLLVLTRRAGRASFGSTDR